MRQMISIVSILILPSVGVPTITAGQQPPRDTVELVPIVVTATRVPSSAVTASTTVISGAELRAEGFTHVSDALAALVPGATVVRTGSFGGTTSLFLRGGESGYVRVLLDGVPLNEPGGAFDFSSLTTSGVERIEVVRGPTSVLYGTDAVTGVIQIFTRRGTGAPHVSVDVMGGNYGTASLSTGLTGASSTTSYGVHLSRYQSNGIYAFNNQYYDTKLTGAVRLLGDNRTDASITLHYSDDVYHFPTDGSGAVVDRNAFQFNRRYALGVEAGRRLSKQADVRIQLSAYTTGGGIDDQADGPDDTLGFYADRSLQTVERRSADARLNLDLPPAGVLTIGGQAEQERERSLDQSQSEFGPSNGLFDEERHNAAGYAQFVGLAGRVAWNASARADRNEAFGSFATYRGGIAVRIASGGRARASVGTAFREPTFFESFASGFVRGNPALKPERTTSWDVGLEQTLPGRAGRISAVWFDQRFKNLIDFTFVPPGPDDPNYYNIAAARSRGAELEVTLQARGIVAYAQYTFLQTRVLDAGFDSSAFGLFLQDSTLLRRPARAGGIGLGYSFRGRGSLNLRINQVGTRADVDYANARRVQLAGYTTVDLTADYTPVRTKSAELTLRLRVGNLANSAYQPVVGYPAPGRTILTGVAAEF